MEETPEKGNLVSLVGFNSSSCGYCHSEDDSFFTYGLWAHSITSQSYQDFVDRGWRRSGHYLYKPNLRRSCCRLYTIRLDANAFHPSRQARKALNRFNRTLRPAWEPPKNSQFNLDESVHCAQTTEGPLHIELEKAGYSDEKFELFKNYQVHVHQDEPSEVSKKSFSRFLCDSPLVTTDPSDSTPSGSFHQLYRIHGELIALAVIDILPQCVSSVYFIYDFHRYRDFSMGRISACREALLARELGLPFYYMGYYIHSCTKMKYKGEYEPSQLLDPQTLQYYPLDQYKNYWRQHGDCYYSPGSETAPPDSLEMPGSDRPTRQDLDDLVLMNHMRLLEARMCNLPADLKQHLYSFIAIAGIKLSKDLIICV